MGLLSSCRERNYYKNTKDPNIAKCYFNFIGVITIYEKCAKLALSDWDNADIKHLTGYNDVCIRNVGVNKNNKIVLVDYG